MGLTYIIKTFRTIHIHFRSHSLMQNLPLMIRIIAQREPKCKISLTVHLAEMRHIPLLAGIIDQTELEAVRI